MDSNSDPGSDSSADGDDSIYLIFSFEDKPQEPEVIEIFIGATDFTLPSTVTNLDNNADDVQALISEDTTDSLPDVAPDANSVNSPPTANNHDGFNRTQIASDGHLDEPLPTYFEALQKSNVEHEDAISSSSTPTALERLMLHQDPAADFEDVSPSPQGSTSDRQPVDIRTGGSEIAIAGKALPKRSPSMPRGPSS